MTEQRSDDYHYSVLVITAHPLGTLNTCCKFQAVVLQEKLLRYFTLGKNGGSI